MVNKEEWESSALHKAVTEMAFLTPWKFFVLPSHSQNKGGTFQKRQENRRKKLLPKQDPDLSVTNMQNCMNEQRRNPYRGRNEYNFANVVDVLNNSFFFFFNRGEVDVRYVQRPETVLASKGQK
jgi:hypothetical protein